MSHLRVQFEVDAAFIADLKHATNAYSTNHVMQQALTLLCWAVEERRKGRVVLSANSDGTDVERLGSDFLYHILTRRKPSAT